MTPAIPRTLVLLDHPDLSRSRVNHALAAALEDAPGLAVRDLRRLYPDGRINLGAERAEVEAADNIVLQYPTHWYAPPAFIKNWLDEVLVRGWAYGTGAPGALAGKTLRVATSTGGTRDAYSPDGFHGWDFTDILIPLQATARRLGMQWLSPFVLHGVRDLTEEQLQDLARDYRRLLEASSVPEHVS
jgi:putative NADPH-quinone reductase